MGLKWMSEGVRMLREGKSDQEVANALDMHWTTIASWRHAMRAVEVDENISVSVLAYLCRTSRNDFPDDDPPGVAPTIRHGRSRYWRNLAHYVEWAEAANAPMLDLQRVEMFGGTMPAPRHTQAEPDVAPEPEPAPPVEGIKADTATTPARPSVVGRRVESASLPHGESPAVVLGWWAVGADAYLMVQSADGQIATVPATSCRVVGGAA